MSSPARDASAVSEVKTQAGGNTTKQPHAERKLPDGTTVVAVRMLLPAGWNRDQTTVEFVLPIPYPNAQPDCFYADADLRLASGAMPTNTGQQVLGDKPRLWFSWHVSSWNPGVDNIHTYLRFIESRFRDAR